MMQEENVCVEKNAEQAAAAEMGTTERTDGTEKGSTAFGKFKDADALRKAYDCLQAEFTRRSQKLKALQKQVDTFTATKPRADGNGVEKLRKAAAERRAEEGKFDDFIAEVERAARTPDGAEETQPDELNAARVAEGEDEAKRDVRNVRATEEEGTMERGASERTLAQKAATEAMREQQSSRGKEDVTSDELYERARADESVRLRLIGEYLASIGRGDAPLLCGGTGALTAPPLRAKNVREAGDMALRMFKNSGRQA